MSTALTVSDVDSCGERLPLKGLRKVTILYVFSLLLLLQTGNIKNKKLVWLVWKDCQMSSSYQTAGMFSLKKRYLQKEKPNLSASEWKSLIPSCAVLHTTETPALYKAYTFPLWFKSIVVDTSCLWHRRIYKNTQFQGIIYLAGCNTEPRGQTPNIHTLP